MFSLQNATGLKSLPLKLTEENLKCQTHFLAISVAKEAVSMATVGYRAKCPI